MTEILCVFKILSYNIRIEKVATVFGSAVTIAQFAGAILSIVNLIKSAEFKDLSISECMDVISGTTNSREKAKKQFFSYISLSRFL